MTFIPLFLSKRNMNFMILYSGATLPQNYADAERIKAVNGKPTPMDKDLFQKRTTSLNALKNIKTKKVLSKNESIYCPSEFHNLLRCYANLYEKTMMACAQNINLAAQKHKIKTNDNTVKEIREILDSVNWPRDNDDSPFKSTSTNLKIACKFAIPSYKTGNYNYVGFVDMFIIPLEKLSSLGAIFLLDEQARLTFLEKQRYKTQEEVAFPLQLPYEYFIKRIGVEGGWGEDKTFSKLSKNFKPIVTSYSLKGKFGYPFSIYIKPLAETKSTTTEYMQAIQTQLKNFVKILTNMAYNIKPFHVIRINTSATDLVFILYAIEVLGRNPKLNHIKILLYGKLPDNNPDLPRALAEARKHPNFFEVK